MQIVIDIPESVKQAFDNATEDDIYGCYYDYNSLIGRAIKNGVPTEPCEDCISREDTLNVMHILMDNARIGKADDDYETLDDIKEQYLEIVKGMVSIQPISAKDNAGNFVDILKEKIEDYKSEQLPIGIGIEYLQTGKEIALDYVLSLIDCVLEEIETDAGSD